MFGCIECYLDSLVTLDILNDDSDIEVALVDEYNRVCNRHKSRRQAFEDALDLVFANSCPF